MAARVMDASALLAFLQGEPGSHVVEGALPQSVVPAPNWSETAQKVARIAGDPAPVLARLIAVGVEVEPLLRVDAELAARLWAAHPHLSLADRCCLAVAARLEVPVLTADRSWSTVDPISGIVVDIVQIR